MLWCCAVMFIIAVLGLGVNVVIFGILGGHHHGAFHSHDHCHSHGDSHDHSHSHMVRSSATACLVHPGCEPVGVCWGEVHTGMVLIYIPTLDLLAQDEEKGCGEGEACKHNGSHGVHGHGVENINMRGAIIHALGDLVQSVGVVVASAIIWWKEVSEISPANTKTSSARQFPLALSNTQFPIPDLAKLAMSGCTGVMWKMMQLIASQALATSHGQYPSHLHAEGLVLKQGHRISCCACHVALVVHLHVTVCWLHHENNSVKF